ncbi:MAG: SusC/RagA family TonB-linked outer membrane protein [Odoribacteraceae bacterium]|nr:SusC/RagA family TonB-linked outer membrane protein [Odoribacteraceae bacterium]
MKMLFFVFALTLSTVNATTHAQVRLNMDVKNATLQEVFRQITLLTGYEFVYSSNELRGIGRISLKAEEMELSDVLEACLRETHLWYLVEEEIIVISPKLSNPAKRQQAQPQRSLYISGKVVDAEGKPLPGATVQVKGTIIGTITDVDGKFRISLPERGAQELLITFIGMKSRTLLLTERPASGEWLLVMEEDLLHLDDVIVTGFKNIPKHELTGSVKRLEAEDILQGSKFSLDQMLAGQVAGMSVITTSGEPSATPKIRIRGTSSILSNKTPLWVVDGIILSDPTTVQSLQELENINLNGDDASYLIGNAIAGLNPQDIESINVLKDAAATSLYGIQAANGVIVVTTKRGHVGKAVIRYSGNVTLSRRESYKQRYLMNASERIKLSQEIMESAIPYGRFPTGIGYEGLYMQYQNKEITYDEFLTGLDKMAKRNTDWYDLLFRNPVSHNHTVSVSGGNEQTRYYASLGYTDSQGTAITSESQRYNASMSIDSWLRSNLNMSLKLSANTTRNRGFYGANPSEWARTTSRTIPAYNDDGSYHFYTTNYRTNSIDPSKEPLVLNYLNELQETGQRAAIMNLTTSLALRWDVINGLRYELIAGVVESRNTVQSWASDRSYTVAKIRGYNYGARDPFSADEEASTLPYGGTFSNSERRETDYSLRNQLTYTKTINEDHLFSVMGVSVIRSTLAKGYSSKAYGWRGDRGQLISPQVNVNNYKALVAASLLSPVIVDNVKNTVSWLGSASYSYKDKFILNGDIRTDGSNQFGENPEHRFLPVWSLSGKYTLSNEDFLKDNDLLTYLALRGSYGFQGNVDKNTSPDLVVQLQPYNSDRHFDMASIYLFPNPGLRWEQTESYTVGLEFALGQGRLSGTIETYKKYGTDMILRSEVPQYNGVDFTKINSGKMTNSGFEVDVIGYPIRTKEWEVGIGLVMGHNKNVVTKANSLIEGSNQKTRNANQVNGNAIIVSEAYGTLWSYRFAGLDHDTGLPLFYENGEKEAYLKKNGSFWEPSDASDTLAIRVPNYTVYDDAVDIVRSGAPTPTLTGGLNLSLRYKNLRVRAGFTFSVGGVDRLPALYNGEYDHVFDPIYNVSKELSNRWKKPGDEAFTNIPALYDRIAFQDLVKRSSSTGGKIRTTTNGTDLYDRSDIMIAPTDNLRMNNLNISYLLPDNFVNLLGVHNMDISFQATNLFLIADKAWRGRDPEQSGSANVRPPSTFTLGVNMSF